MEIIINGTIGANGIGNNPDDNATTDGTIPTKIALPVPIVTAPKNKVALIIGPVINWLWINLGKIEATIIKAINQAALSHFTPSKILVFVLAIFFPLLD